MARTIVNLAVPIVVSEMEAVLETYPYHPHQQAFANPGLRQKLIAFVLSRVPGSYAVVDEAELPVIDMRCLHYSLEQQMEIETLLHQGIEQIFREDPDWNPQETSSGLAPSRWFG